MFLAAMPPVTELQSPKTRRWQAAAVVGLAFAAVIIRLAPLLRVDLSFAYIHEDSFWFMQTAGGIRHGCGFARWINGACAPAEIMRTPGYPLMLALIPDARLTMVVQDLLGGLICLFVALSMWRCWGIGAALIAEFFIAFDLPSIVFADHVMSEQLFQLMLILAMIPPLLVVSGVLKGPKTLAATVFSAAMAGSAILVRPIGIPIALLMPIPFLFVAAPRRTRVVTALIAFAIPMLTVFGWSVRNYAVSGYFGISTTSAINLYFYRAAEVVARENGTGLRQAQDAMGRRLGVGMDHIYDAEVQSAALVRRMDRLAKDVLLAHPMETLAMTVENAGYIALFPMRTQLAYVLGTSGGSEGWGLSAGAPRTSRFKAELRKMLGSPILSILVAFQELTLLAMWAGVIWALLRCPRSSAEYRLWTLFPTLVSMVLLLTGAGGEADVRFRVPVVPLLAIVAALGYSCAKPAPELHAPRVKDGDLPPRDEESIGYLDGV